MFRTLIYPSSGACDCAAELTHPSFSSRFVVCWSFGVARFEWCPCCRLLDIWCGWVWVVLVLQAEASACNTDTTQIQPHQISNSQRTENKTKDVIIQQNIYIYNILMSETCWVRKKWNKIASDKKLVFYSPMDRNFISKEKNTFNSSQGVVFSPRIKTHLNAYHNLWRASK